MSNERQACIDMLESALAREKHIHLTTVENRRAEIVAIASQLRALKTRPPTP